MPLTRCASAIPGYRSLPFPLTVLAVGVIAAACGKPEGQRPSGAAETLPAPPRAVALAAGGVIDRQKIRQEGQSQRYDGNPGASDEAVLDDGVHAVVEPQEGVWQIDSAALYQGVVVARFRNLGDTPLKRLGLAPRGTTYWYIYRNNGRLLSAYIADTDSTGYDRVDVPTVKHPPSRRWRQSVAQWQLPGVLGEGEKQGLNALGLGSALSLASAVQPWVTCTSEGCCKPTN